MKDWTISSENDVWRVVLNEFIGRTAYSIGAILGDGYLRYLPEPGSRKKGSMWITELSSMDIEIINRYWKELKDVFGAEYAVSTRKLKSGIPFYTLRASRKDIFDWFFTLTQAKFVIPIEIFRLDADVKRSFLAGIFDTDGSVKFTHRKSGAPRWLLGFSNTKLGLVEGVASILRMLNVRVGTISTFKKGTYRTVYSIHPNIRDFIEAGCYFESKRKQTRLMDYHDHIVGSETMYTTSMTMDEDIVRQ